MNRKGFVIVALVCLGLFGLTSIALAVDKVICVPWQGDTAKHHTAISGTAVQLKAIVKTDSTATRWYKWVLGDGSETTVSTLSGSTKHNVETTHTYSGAVGTPFTARLLVDAVDSSMANAVSDTYLLKIEDDEAVYTNNNLDARINIAIDRGLWWLYKNGTYIPGNSGNWRTYNSNPAMYWIQTSYEYVFASPTASAIQAFTINNHKIKGNPDEDPYVEAVKLGMNWLMQGYYSSPTSYPMLRALAVSTQHSDNPEAGQSSPNGYGIEVRDYGSRPIYQGGQVMDAIIASGVLPADLTGRDFTKTDGTIGKNWTYGELLQDMADMYAYGQYDGNCSWSAKGEVPAGSGICGGWRYSWGDFPDNSAAQWAAIGMIPAQQAPWNVIVPAWVKNYNINWLNYSFSPWSSGVNNYGGFGYTGAGSGWGTSPSGLVQMTLDGQIGFDNPATPGDDRDSKWIRTERYFADNWTTFRDSNELYGKYAFTKAMRLALPQPVERLVSNNLDWYKGSGGIKGLAEKLTELQNASGYWTGDYTNEPLSTAWVIIILKPTLFEASPIACFSAAPNPNYPNQTIYFNPSCSGHSETGKDINNLTKFEWDWESNGTYDQFTNTPVVVTHSFPCAVLPCTYPVTLRVTDDSTPVRTATYTLNISISNPPHPPVAEANGPYMVSLCSNDSLTLNGSNSYDPNEGQHEGGCNTCPNDTITAWDWDLTSPLTGFNDVSGRTPTVNPGTYFTAGAHDIGLRVTDNTALAYPGSGNPAVNLTGTDFGQVTVYSCGAFNLAARPKLSKVQLTWTHWGAGSYDIYRSTLGPNSGFVKIKSGAVTTYATYLDSGVVAGTKYYYRVVGSDSKGTNAASAKPMTR